jgi:hypothetical protein
MEDAESMLRPACNLALTEQERAALSIALRTLLKGWGESEDQSQKRLHARLLAISAKLDALNPDAALAATKTKERQRLSH